MRLGVVHPTVWPEVRRGTERFIHEYANYMAGRGHEVTVLAASDDGAHVRRERNYVVEYRRRLWRPSWAKLGLYEYHVFAASVPCAVRGRGFDVVHCFNFMDALAAGVPLGGGRPRILLHLVNLPPQVEYRRVASAGGRFLRLAVRRADRVLTVGRRQREYFARRTARADLDLIHPPVDLDEFRLARKPAPDPATILFASAAGDRRKGVRALFRAFGLLARRRGDVRLAVASEAPDKLRGELLELLDAPARERVRDLGLTPRQELPALFGRAAVVALPSMGEAFPLTVAESLAVGTPVVGTNDGGIPELIGDPAVGALFDPGDAVEGEPSNIEGLAAALERGLALAGREETAGACRRAVSGLSWIELGPRYEALLAETAGAATARPEEVEAE